jgi:hypothetical protein
MAEIWKPKDQQVLKNWIFQSLYHSREPLTDWERSFIVSVDKWLDKHGQLSQKQEEVLERIYAEKT